MILDESGQPPPRVNGKQRATRDVSEFMGLCQGVIADGVISQDEITYIARWLESHPDSWGSWPVSTIISRLNSILSDEIYSEDEERDLLELMTSICRVSNANEALAMSSDLPLSYPAPPVNVEGYTFCLTGTFEFGTRMAVINELEKRGGIMLNGIRKDLDYLIVGSIASRDWKHSSFGNKILQAVEYREKGLPVHIISEQHWALALAL